MDFLSNPVSNGFNRFTLLCKSIPLMYDFISSLVIALLHSRRNRYDFSSLVIEFTRSTKTQIDFRVFFDFALFDFTVSFVDFYLLFFNRNLFCSLIDFDFCSSWCSQFAILRALRLLHHSLMDCTLERKLEKEAVQLTFYTQLDGPVTGNGRFESSTLDPGSKVAFYVGPPTKDRIPKNCPEGSLLLGAISYGKPSAEVVDQGNDPEKNPASYLISYRVPPAKVDEDKGKSSASTKSTKSVSERLEEDVRDAKIKVLASLKQDTEDEREEWKKLSISLKSEYPKYSVMKR